MQIFNKCFKIDQKLIRNLALTLGAPVAKISPKLMKMILLGISDFSRLRYSILDATACFCWALGLGAIVAGIDQLT